MDRLIIQNNVPTIESREVAEMIDMQHKNLLKKVREYEKILTGSKLSSLDFFIPSTYKDSKGEERKCYLLTRKGCEMVANKLTGAKGVIFTAEYVSRFEEMEKQLSNPEIKRLPDNYLEALKELVKQVEENELLKEENKQLKALKELDEISVAVENVTSELKLYSTESIAVPHGMTARELHQFLYQHRVIYRERGKWHVYYPHKRKNLAKNYHSQLKWTEKGKDYIENLLIKYQN